MADAFGDVRAVGLEEAGKILVSGGCLVYPTETLYGLGALADRPEALARIARLKGRPASKPLPLVVGALSQMAAVTVGGFEGGPLHADFLRLAKLFWPGPLSLVLPSRETLPGEVRDASGRTSVRLTPHPVAAALCLAAGGPLAATSANMSGRSAVFDPDALDPAIAKGVDGIVLAEPRPKGGAPSTVVVLHGQGRLEVVREGAVAVDALLGAGFSLF